MMAEISPCNPGSLIIHGSEQTRFKRMDIVLDNDAWRKLKKYIERFDGDTFGSLAEAIVRGISILDAQRSMDEYGDRVDA